MFHLVFNRPLFSHHHWISLTSKQSRVSHMFTQWSYLWYLSVELRHIISQQSAKFSKSLLMPRIIFQRHFALYFCVINHNWAKLTTSVRRIERCTCLPVILKPLSDIHRCDATRVPQWLSLYTCHTMQCLLLVVLITTAVIHCANRSRPSVTNCWHTWENNKRNTL